MKFDFDGAKKAGLSDDEIVDYISKLPNNGNLDALKEMGASSEHIVNLWSASKNFSISNPTDKISNTQTQEQQSILTPNNTENPSSVKELFENIPTNTPTNPPSEENNTPPIEQTQSNPQEPMQLPISKDTIPTEKIEPPKPSGGFLNILKDTLYDTTGIPLGDAKTRAKMQEQRDDYLAEQIANSNKQYSDLNPEEKDYIERKYTSDNSVLGLRLPASLVKSKEEQYNDTIKDVQEKKQLKEILGSDLSYDDLTLEQKQILTSQIKSSTGKTLKYAFDSKEEMFDDLKKQYQIHQIAPTIEQSLSELNNISANKRLYNIFSSDPDMRNKYLSDVYNIATNAGFDNVSVDSTRHKMYFIKDDKAYEVKEGFLESIWEDIKSSKFELGASLAGAVAGSKFGVNPASKLAGGIIGGAVGAIGGAGIDYQINSWLLKRDKDNSELLGKMLEAGSLSAVGDVATLGAIKLVKTGYNSLKKIPSYANTLRENFTNQNINGAMQLLEDVGISKQQAQQTAQKMDKYVQTRFVADKDDSFLDKAISKISKINDSVKQKEKIAFDVAYADPVLWKYIGAVAKNEPKFSNFIHNSITDRAKKISLDPQLSLGNIQTAIKEYEKSLSNEYGEALDLLNSALPNYRFYPQEFLENKLSKIAEHIGENKSEGIIAGLNHQIKDMGDGLDVSQMIDIRKLINKTLRKNAKFDYNDIGALKDINSYIDSNIEEALLKNAKAEPKIELLYDEWKKINARYADYKELQDSKLYKDIFSENYNNDEKLGNAFISWSKTDERLADSIIGRLDPRMQDKTQAFILAKSINKHIQDTLNDGKVVDFLELKKTLSALEPKITNESLKEHINILKDMADLFYNDINLMREAGQINILTPNSGSGISHDLIARAHTSTISNIYRSIQRFLPTTAGKNSAFLYHLAKAMNMSRNSKELLFDLATSPDTPPSMLKELRPAIEAYNGRVGSAIDKAQEIQTQKDEQNYIDMLESSQNYQRSLNDTSRDSQALEEMETSGISDVGNTGEQAISHRGDSEGLLSDSGEIRATARDRDGEFGRVSRNPEGGDRPLRFRSDTRGDERARNAREIQQEPQEISQRDKSSSRTSRGRLEAKQTTDGTVISQEGLPPSPSLNSLAKNLKNTKEPLETITDFGTNYPEYYHNGKGAIEKLLAEKQGQVQGAFYRPDIGDITLVWGKEGTGKSDGFGLAKIAKFHPEALDKLDEIVSKGNFLYDEKQRPNIVLDNYIVGIRNDWKGGETPYWVISSYKKDSIKGIDSNGTTAAKENYSLNNPLHNSTTQELKNQLQEFNDFITKQLGGKIGLSKAQANKFYEKIIQDWEKAHPNLDSDMSMLYDHFLKNNLFQRVYGKTPSQELLDLITISADAIAQYKQKILQKNLKNTKDPLETITDFGTNYPEYYHNGKGAIEKLLAEKQGQVQGAFYKEGLGDIDLVWGNKSGGLKHIIDKHGLESAKNIDDVINNGEIFRDKHKRLGILKDNQLIGINEKYKGKDKIWVVTSYELEDPKQYLDGAKAYAPEQLGKTNLSRDLSDNNSTTQDLKNQDKKTISQTKNEDKDLLDQLLSTDTIKESLRIKEAIGDEKISTIDKFEDILRDTGIARMKEALKVEDFLKSPQEILKYFKLKRKLASLEEKVVYAIVENTKTTEFKKRLEELNKEQSRTYGYTNSFDGNDVSNLLAELKHKASKTNFYNLQDDEQKIIAYLKKEKKAGFKDLFTPSDKNYSEYYHKGKEAIDKLLQTKEGQVKGAFYRDEIGDINLSSQSLEKIKYDYGTRAVEKLPDIINNGELFRNPKNNRFHFIKDNFMLRADNERNILDITEWDNEIIEDYYKMLEPISTLQKSTSLPTEELKNQDLNKEAPNELSNHLKKVYDKYEITKTPEYQQAKEVQKSDAITGLSSSMLLKQADEILNKDPLELAFHNNWVKEELKEPFGINFKKSLFEKLEGANALETLLNFKLGQVKGAFHKEGLGDIDLVWGNSKMGLAHILEKHPEVIDKIPEIINDGEILNKGETRKFIKNEKYNIVISENFRGKDKRWLLTAYEDYPSQPMSISDGFNSRLQHESSQNNPLSHNSTTQELKNQDNPLIKKIDKLMTKKELSQDALEEIFFEAKMPEAFKKFRELRPALEANPDDKKIAKEYYEGMLHAYEAKEYLLKNPYVKDSRKEEELKETQTQIKKAKEALKALEDGNIIVDKELTPQEKYNQERKEKELKQQEEKNKARLQNALKKYPITSTKEYQNEKGTEAIIGQFDSKTAFSIGEENPQSVLEEIKSYEKKLLQLQNETNNYLEGSKEYKRHIYEMNEVKKFLKSNQKKRDFFETHSISTQTAEYLFSRSFWVKHPLKELDNYTKQELGEPFGVNFTNNLGKPFKGITALETLLNFKLGQVKGAFHKEGLGDIDLVWGDEKMGLAHILEKHPEVIDKIPEIIEKGEVIKNGRFETIVFENNGIYRVGLSKGWHDKGDNNWVITAYEDTRLPHSDALPSNGVASRDVLPSNNLETNPTTEELKNQELLETAKKLEEKYPQISDLPMIVYQDYNTQKVFDEANAYSLLKEKYKSIIKTKKTLEGKKLTKEGVQNHQYALNMISTPEVEKFLKAMNDDVYEILELKSTIKYREKKLKNYKESFSTQNEIDWFEQLLQEDKKAYEQKMRKIYGKYPLEEVKQEDLILQAFSEFSSEGFLSDTTQTALEKNGNKIKLEGENITISHPLEKGDKDLEPLPNPATPKAIITPKGYKEFDSLGNEIKEVSLSSDTLSSIQKEGNIITKESLDLNTHQSTKEIEIKNPEVNLPITSASSSSAPSSSTIAKLKDDFKISPDSIISKSPKQRFDGNIEAIRILKKLQEDKALPTLEEKQKLSSYVGWGGLANSFKEDSVENKLLRELLSPEEYTRAKNSTLSSYYTPYFVVDSMWKALQKMGFRGGEILEPSVGVGNFFGLLPDELRHTSNLTGIELDNTTAKIAKYLYPSAKIEHMGYEEATLSKNNYDLVIGNPPYGSFSVYDKNFKKESKHNIHNYFMLKNLALVKEDGILAQIITTNFLDTKNPEVRELIAKEAEFLGAIRLPQGSFDDTQVATDIVFFRKLKKDESSPSREWVNLKSIPDTQGKEDIPINSYFASNPEYMLGVPGRYGGMYGADTVGFRSNGNTQTQLKEAINKIAEGIHIDTRPVNSNVDIAQMQMNNFAPKITKEDLLHSEYSRSGSIAVDEQGEVYRITQEGVEKVPDLELIDKTQEDFDKLTEIGKKAKLAQIKKIKEMIPAVSQIRDTLMHLKRLQLDPMQGDALISTYRKELNTFYDDFRDKFHTYLSDSKISKAFDGDPTYPHIAALEEDYKRVDGKYQAKKADIFSKRTQFPYVKPEKAKSVEDGILISYNQTGRLDFDMIAELLDKDTEVIKKEMLSKNLIFKDAEGNIIYAPEFLSGNILAKIKSFEEKELDVYQNKALNALREVIPAKVEIEGIGINMGASYIPIEIYQDFAKEILGGSEKNVSYQKLTDEFIVNFKSSIEADKAFGVVGKYKNISASDIFDSALNDRKIIMGEKRGEIFYSDADGQNALDQQIGVIKEAFKNFVYEDYKRAEKIENIYNDIFNNTQLREFDGSFLKLEGSSDLISLRPHQKNAIYRVISSPTTLLDHTVGTGKTYTMAGSAMELRRLGLAQKPLIVVPNHIVNQFGAEFARLYPSANILATRKFDKKSRQRTISAITTGDYDAIIIGHSNFEMLPMSKQAEMKFMSEQINAFEQAIVAEKIENTGKSLSVKKLEAALEGKKRKLDELMDSKRDETIHFEDLGIDALFLDEAHEFKNLEFFSRQNISGLGNQKGSKKAFDLFMKTRYLQDKNKKIIFATGTPISNSVAELYTLQKYLDFKALKEKGINTFDQWSKTFGKVETRFENHPSGDFKLTNRLTGYINMPELIKEYKKFADVIVNEDVEAMLKLQGKEFNLPKAEFITVEIKKSPRQEDFMQDIMERSNAIDSKKVEPDEDNYLKVTTDGKKGSLDMRLINPLYEDNPDSKVNTAITNIIKEYNKWKEDKGTQLVFLDMSTPKNKNAKLKKDLDELLKRIEKGDSEAEEILKKKGGRDWIEFVNNSGFSVYDDIKEKLMKEGIPEKEIAFIHNYDTDKKKAELFNKVNDGEVRILLGSTSKMGAGTNVQERIIAIHHLDAPWRPADIEQRNGRGIRQGNSLYEKYGKDKFKVNIYTYVTKGMLDTMIFEKLHTKAKFISQLRKGELSGREIEDIGDEVLNFAEIQAATLEDRRYLEILELKRDIESLKALQKNIANINLRTNREIKALEYELAHKPKEIEAFKTDMESFNKAGNKVQIGNTTYTRGEKDNRLSQALENIKIDRDLQSIYKYNGFIIEASVSKRNADFGYVDLIAHSPSTNESYLISTTKKQDFKANGALIKIDNYFKAPRLIAMQDELKKAQITLPKLKNSLKKFDKQQELEEKTKRHIKLIEDLKNKLNSHPYVGLGLFGAISGGQIDYNQDGKNDEADMLLGALGAVIGARAVKYLLSRNKDVIRNVLKHHFPDKKEEIDTAFKKDIQKEKRGIYNVAYNNKKATIIKEDLKSIENAILFEKGRQKNTNKGYGAYHINVRHSNPKDIGYITQEEYLNLGNAIREYIREHKEPYVDKNGSRLYEWKNKHGVSFRVVVGNRGKGASTSEATENQLPFPSHIITFYSDRNFKQKMKFRNPNLRDRGITLW